MVADAPGRRPVPRPAPRRQRELARIEPLVDAYATHWEGGPDIVLMQLLADLRHYADKHGLDMGACDRQAHVLYLEDKS